jgi:hypothetical protein
VVEFNALDQDVDGGHGAAIRVTDDHLVDPTADHRDDREQREAIEKNVHGDMLIGDLDSEDLPAGVLDRRLLT